MYYKNILVITDNLLQYKRFFKLIKTMNLGLSNFMFHQSPNNKVFTNLSESLPSITPIDINKDTDYIIKNYDLVFSLHCTQLFHKRLLNSVKCINIHPGYNPVNRGWYPQIFAIIYNLPTGATIHEISPEIDKGPIIDRKKVPIFSYDTSLTVYNRICDVEIELLRSNLIPILENRYKTLQPESEGSLFLKKDFRSLCKLDLDKTGSFRSFIDTLRALSHGEYKNAYFIDKKNNKIFVRIILEKE